MKNLSQGEIRSLEKEAKRKIQKILSILFLAIIAILLTSTKFFFKVSALLGTNYFRDNRVAYLISASRFFLFAVVIGACFFLWKKGRNQFWYGVIEIVGSVTYIYYYLDSGGDLPYINWLTAFYFTSRGFQNTSEGWSKKFKYKRYIYKIIIKLNLFIINPFWRLIRPKHNRTSTNPKHKG